jgi:hypothetical protein
VLYQYNGILVYKHNKYYHKMTIISSLVQRHVSAKYSHHQANIESRFRYIKCAPSGIPLSLQQKESYLMYLQQCKWEPISLVTHFKGSG